jgi:hypothetical protein
VKQVKDSKAPSREAVTTTADRIQQAARSTKAFKNVKTPALNWKRKS